MNQTMTQNEKTKFIAHSAAIAALYVAITLAIQPISYGPVQFRLSEIMVLLVLINPRYKTGLILGCMIANFFSPFGLVDVIFGTAATALALFAMTAISGNRKVGGSKQAEFKDVITDELSTGRLLLASLMPTIINGIIIGLELVYMLNLPFVETALYVALGEFLVVTVIGVPLFKVITNRLPVRVL